MKKLSKANLKTVSGGETIKCLKMYQAGRPGDGWEIALYKSHGNQGTVSCGYKFETCGSAGIQYDVQNVTITGADWEQKSKDTWVCLHEKDNCTFKTVD